MIGLFCNNKKFGQGKKGVRNYCVMELNENLSNKNDEWFDAVTEEDF